MSTPKVQLKVYKLRADANMDDLRKTLTTQEYRKLSAVKPGFEIYVRTKERPPRWLPLVAQITLESIELSNKEASFVLIRVTDYSAYAITGGQGHTAIQNYIDVTFGLETISRLIHPNKIKLRRDKSLTGRVDQSETIYRRYENYNTDPLDWAKLLKHVLGEADKNHIEQALGLARNDEKPIRIEGGSSFSIKRAITIEEVETITSRLDNILERPQRFPVLKGFSELITKEEKESSRQRLDEVLRSEYYKYLQEGERSGSSSLDISYEDAREFVLASKFRLSFWEQVAEVDALDIDVVFHHLQKFGVPGDRLTSKLLQRCKVEAFDSDGRTLFKSNVASMLVAEFSCQNRECILVDGRWFVAERGFVRELEEKLQNFVADQGSYSLPEWPEFDGKLAKEEDYISRVATCFPGFCSLHGEHIMATRAPGDKVELCDLLDTRGNTVNLVFVKRGIAGQVRELASQARDSIELLFSEPTFYERAVKKIEAKCGLNGLLDRENIGVLLAVVDHVGARRSREPLAKRMSTLAKLEAVHALQFLRGQGVKRLALIEISVASASGL